MALSSSLATQGSFPTLQKPYGGPSLSVSSPTRQVNQTGLISDGTNSGTKLPTTTVPLTSGMLPPSAPKATTPLASTTVTDPTGGTVTHKYQNAPSAASSSYDGPNYSGLVGTDMRAAPGVPSQSTASNGTDQPATPTNQVTPSSTSSSNTQQVDTPQTLNQSVVTSLANSGVQPGTAYTNAQDQYDSDKQALADYQQSVADEQKGISSTPGILSQAIGQGANLANTAASKEAALQGAITADTNVLGAANTQQQTQQSALNEAAGFTQPQSQFGLLTNPQTGQPLNPSIIQSAVSQAQQLVQNGADPQGSAVQALLSPFGFVGNLALDQAQQAVSGGSYNPTTQSAASQAQASNVGTAGTASTQVAADGYASTLPVYQQASTDFTTADQQASNLLDTLNQTGINSTNATDYNTTINGLATKLGSTQTTAFTTALTEAQQAYTKLLSSVGASTPTVNGEAATSVLSPSSTPAQIAESIDKLNQAAYAKLAPQYQQALTYYNQLHGTNETSIPGYPAPVQPTPVSKNPPQGPDTSSGNLQKAGVGGTVQGVEGIGNSVLGFISKL